MPRLPRRLGRGWSPRLQVLVVAVIAAALVLGAAALHARRAGNRATAGVRVVASTATTTPVAVAATAIRTPPPTATPTPSPSPTPTPSPTPAPPRVVLSPARVGNGTTMLVVVTAPAGDGGSIDFRDHTFPLRRNGEELWTVIGVPLDTPAGSGALTVSLTDAAGMTAGSLDAPYTVFHIDRPIDNLTLTSQEASILTVAAAQEEAKLRTEQFSRFDPVREWTAPFQWPVTGPITTYFGQGRRINGGPPGDFHSGTDIAANEGTPVHAAADGRVSWTGRMPIRGNTIVIDHGAGVMTSYSHLSEIDVVVDQQVHRGDVIGKIGHTGLATGPHLHWELLIYGTDVDAIEWTKTNFTPPTTPPVATPTPAPTTTQTAGTSPAASPTRTATPGTTAASSATPGASPAATAPSPR